VSAAADAELALDRPALDWLDRLLDGSLAARCATLAELAERQPELHRRVVRLLTACELTQASQRLCAPLAAGAWSAVPAAVALQAGDELGGYRLLRELGRGGHATVWLAERSDGVLKRPVALKAPLRSLSAAGDAERFARERDVLAALSHPHIARLYDAGVAASGQPFIVMEAIDGQPVTLASDEAGLDLHRRLHLFLQVLAAVDHAHKHLIVHRDLKPPNILVDLLGQPKLLDFGIAKLLGHSGAQAAADNLTRDAGCAITPRYAAPEQLTGGSISTATDVYALGAVLYELLTGELVHARAQSSVAAAVEATLHAEAQPPSAAPFSDEAAARRGLPRAARLRAALTGDLDTIVLKALRKDPADRYTSIEQFAGDIRAHLGHQPIAARPVTLLRRLRLLVQRHRAASLAMAIGVATALGLAVLLGEQLAQTLTQQARGDAVKAFLLDMVESAEPDETHLAHEVTGGQMVATGLRMARERFEGQPQLLGEVLGELARMQMRFGEDTQALQTLQQAQALLSAAAPADDPALNKVRVMRGSIDLRAGNVAAARDLAETASKSCRRQGTECAKARAYAGVLLGSIAARSGQPELALTHARRAVLDTETGFGPHHAETAMAWHQLAVMAREVGELRQADDAIAKATSLAEHAVLTKRDRTLVSRTRAMIDLDLGRYALAREHLRGLAEVVSDGEERGRVWRLLADAELSLGNGGAALAAASTALSQLGLQSRSATAWIARQSHARAESLLGRPEAAWAEMRSVIAGLASAGYTDRSVPVLRARRYAVEVLARAGRMDEALSEIRALRTLFPSPPGGAALELGQLLDLEACVLRALGDAAQAMRLHQQAAELLARQLPPEHPLIERNALYRAWAESQAAGPDDAASDIRHKAMAAAYAKRFSADAVWVRLMHVSAASCRESSAPACVVIL
jgi:serine/threonine-protein kinase